MIAAVSILLIVLVILLVFFIIMLLVTKRQDTTLTTLDSNGKIKNERGSIEQEYYGQNISPKARKKMEKERKKMAKSGKGMPSFDMSGAMGNASNAFNNVKNSAQGYAQNAVVGAKNYAGGAAKAVASAKNASGPKSIVEEKELKEGIKREDIFRFMEFDRILDDMIVQKNGSRFTKAIKCKGINYDLMSEVEQLAVEEGFITFLNTLKYPIQLYVQAQNVDLRQVREKYKDNIKGLEEQYNDINVEYSRLASAFDTDEIELAKVSKERDSITNVYEYARDMLKYVEKMDKNKRMLKRSFYILTSYNTSEVVSAEKFNKDELIEMCSNELTTRCQAIISSLGSCSVTGKMLNSNELAELLYNAYNRDDAGVTNVKENIESGFYRLYSVSEDAFMKKQEALEQYLNDSARVKALESIKYAILNNAYKTPAMEELEQREDISRRATNMINAENYDKDFKDQVNKKILEDYRADKKVLLEMDAEQKEMVKQQSEEDAKELEELKKRMAENPVAEKINKNSSESSKDEGLDESLDKGSGSNESLSGDNTNLYSNDDDDDDEII